MLDKNGPYYGLRKVHALWYVARLCRPLDGVSEWVGDAVLLSLETEHHSVPMAQLLFFSTNSTLACGEHHRET